MNLRNRLWEQLGLVQLARQTCRKGYILLALMRRYIVYCVCLWVTPATKSTNFCSRYLGKWSREEDEIFQSARGELMYTTTQTGDPSSRGSPWGTKILKGVKKNF